MACEENCAERIARRENCARAVSSSARARTSTRSASIRATAPDGSDFSPDEPRDLRSDEEPRAGSFRPVSSVYWSEYE